MKAPRVIVTLLVVLMLVLSACGATPTPTPVPPTATPVPPTATPKPALNVATVIDTYLTNLPAGFGGVAPAAFNEQLAAAKPFILDVRETSEVTSGGTIAGAVNIPMREVTKNLNKLPAKDQPIVVICGSGHRSAIIMAALQVLGYTNVKSMTSGMGAWKAANLPTVPAATAATAGTAPAVDAALLSAVDAYLAAIPAGYGTIAAAALKDQMAAAKPFILDVREASEGQTAGSIEGSVNVPLRTLAKNLSKLPADKAAPIVVYCAIGHRGAIGMVALQMLGYTNVKSLAGGLPSWTGAGFPVVK